MLKTSWQTGKHLVKGDSENHLKAQSFRLVQWLNTIRFLEETSQGSTNLVRKFYLEYSSDMCWSRGIEKDTLWPRTLRRWKTWTREKSILEASNHKKCLRHKVAEQLFCPNRRGNSKIVCKRRPRTHSKAEQLVRSEDLREELQCISERSEPTETKDDAEAKKDSFQSKVISFIVISSTPRAERRNISNSTETHWCDQGHLHGCVARKPCWRWLERRCGSKFIRFMDRTHEVLFFLKKNQNLLQDICGPGSAVRRSKQLPDLIICGLKCGPACPKQRRRRKKKTGLWRNQSSKTERHLFHRSGKMERQRSHQKREEKVGDSFGGVYVLQNGNKEVLKEAAGNRKREWWIQ